MNEFEKYALEEACRQWIDFIDEAPERKTGKGFAEFYNEIYLHMKKENFNMDKREEIVKRMISAALHTKYENSCAYSKDEILKEAVSLKNALNSLYSVTDKQWQNILADIGSYADCLI